MVPGAKRCEGWSECVFVCLCVCVCVCVCVFVIWLMFWFGSFLYDAGATQACSLHSHSRSIRNSWRTSPCAVMYQTNIRAPVVATVHVLVRLCIHPCISVVQVMCCVALAGSHFLAVCTSLYRYVSSS